MRKRIWSVVLSFAWVLSTITALILLPAQTSAATGSSVAPDLYQYEVLSNVMADMRDGIKLETDVYLPKDKTEAEKEKGFPTLVMRTPYGKESYGKAESPFFAQRGYAVVVQDTTGNASKRSGGLMAGVIIILRFQRGAKRAETRSVR
ncbi:CocE/NonD family hydrolase [Effusibacillus dendaii]|uniref:Xaa-Pro dipeptidyl-peptidase-like domain-containing protein n=1 Tax=Effusibacillus dendaii TaxID=2743772 RepID=A0A7I8D5G9_9BACL|nr:CocE/NonD family hydrolase [Effusibacillus dendaii]BCJ85325.1 hypothetical protein skT53_03100 [Effusibacillus dendaii]